MLAHIVRLDFGDLLIVVVAPENCDVSALPFELSKVAC